MDRTELCIVQGFRVPVNGDFVGAQREVLSQILARGRPDVCLSAVELGGEQVSIEFKGSHFERDVILWGVRWYVAYPISYRQLE